MTKITNYVRISTCITFTHLGVFMIHLERHILFNIQAGIERISQYKVKYYDKATHTQLRMLITYLQGLHMIISKDFDNISLEYTQLANIVKPPENVPPENVPFPLPTEEEKLSAQEKLRELLAVKIEVPELDPKLFYNVELTITDHSVFAPLLTRL